MAPIISLVEQQEDYTPITTLSLYNFTAGFALVGNGWQQAIAAEGDTSVVETLAIVVRGTTHDDLASKMRTLDSLLQTIPRSKDVTQLAGLWLEVKMSNETGTRRAYLLGARRSPTALWSNRVNNATGGFFYEEAYTLALERKPYWESTSAADGAVQAGVSSIGGTSLLHTINGTAPARVESLQITGDVNPAQPDFAAINHIWMGVRTIKYGVLANFQSYWSLRKGTLFGVGADTMGTTGGVTNADATAKDGFRTDTDFTTHPELQPRVTIKTTAVTANPQDQRGTFLVLLRAKLGAAGTVRVRLADGLYGSAQFNVRARVPITSPFYQFYELGTVQIPTPSSIYGVNLLSNYALRIDAERVSGTPHLLMDCLVLVPINEWFATVDAGVNPAFVQAVDYIMMGESPAGRVAGAAVVGANPNVNGIFRISGGMPTPTGMIVMASDRGGLSIVGDINSVVFGTKRRYHSLRGAG